MWRVQRGLDFSKSGAVAWLAQGAVRLTDSGSCVDAAANETNTHRTRLHRCPKVALAGSNGGDD